MINKSNVFIWHGFRSFMLSIKSFKGGYDNNYSYVLYDKESKDCCIVDISLKPSLIMPFIEENNLKLKFVVVMHSHFDHLVGYDYYLENKIPIYAHQSFEKEVDRKLKDGDEIKLGDSSLKIMHTPGHIYDAICILVEGKLFTSDTLFIDECGRCDLGGADIDKMRGSLQRIKSLPDATMIYPGHDYGSVPFQTLGEQKKRNKYLMCEDKEEFMKMRV